MLTLLTVLSAATGAEVQARIDADVAAGRPIVAHVLVALADNEHQGIVKTTNAELGDGQSPRKNLYWGALYGVRSHFPKQGWKLSTVRPPDGVLDRIVLERKLVRNGRTIDAIVVADAWDGRLISKTTAAFLDVSSGRAVEEVRTRTRAFLAGGAAHVVVYVGHNGLMDFELESEPAPFSSAQPKSAVILACASKPYFEERLERVGAHPLLLTTGLMAPEAYTLDAALVSWFRGEESSKVHAAAARAYADYQRSSLRAGERLFWSAE